jgi:glutamate synthase domain-containing protein 3
MSGGVSYVLDEAGRFRARCNTGMVELQTLTIGSEDDRELHELVQMHHKATGSRKAKALLDAWPEALKRFVKVMPVDYKRVLEARKAAERARRQTRPETPHV